MRVTLGARDAPAAGLRLPAPPTIAAGGLTVGAAVAYAWISVYRHNHFGSNALDLAVQDQTIWGYSQLRIIRNTVLGVPNLLGDHFHPVLVTLAPLFWVWNSTAALLVAQAVLLALAGVPVFLFGRDRLGPLGGLAFQASYLVFWGVLAGVVYDFHHVAFAVPAIAGALYATLTHRNRLLWVMVAVCLLTREDVALTVLALGLYIVAVQRRFWLGAVMMGISGAWFVLLLRWIMPALSGAPYSHWTYTALGTGPFSAVAHIVTRPLDSLKLLFTPVEKLRVWVGTLGSWLFLPLGSPLFLVALPSLLERFWSSEITLWSFHFQYSLLAAPILAFAAIDTTSRVVPLFKVGGDWAERSFVPAAVLGASCVLTFALVQPLAELRTYISSGRAAEIQSCLDVIPPAASVSASNFLLPHLSHRSEIYLFPEHAGTEYLAVDVSTYLHFAPGEESQLRLSVQRALDGGYGPVCSRGLTVVMRRGAPPAQLPVPMQSWLQGRCSGAACQPGAA